MVDEQRLILKTWIENGESKHGIYTDLRAALKKKSEDEEFFLIKKLDNIDKLRNLE